MNRTTNKLIIFLVFGLVSSNLALAEDVTPAPVVCAENHTLANWEAELEKVPEGIVRNAGLNTEPKHVKAFFDAMNKNAELQYSSKIIRNRAEKETVTIAAAELMDRTILTLFDANKCEIVTFLIPSIFYEKILLDAKKLLETT
jgi:hypothetical protein